MILFSLLVALALERLFKIGERWRLVYLFEVSFGLIKKPSIIKTLLLIVVWFIIFNILFWLVDGWFLGLITLLLSIAICWFCIGPGIGRRYYRKYLKAAKENDVDMMRKIASELALIYGLPDGDKPTQLRELQNALIWINFRYYLSPLLWYIAFGPIALGCYAVTRGYQTWLARYNETSLREQSGIEKILFCLDWLPARCVGFAYTLLGNGDKALPVWLGSLKDFKTSQFQIVTKLAQLTLANTVHDDVFSTPVAAVTLAKKTTLTIIVVVAILTIYGMLV